MSLNTILNNFYLYHLFASKYKEYTVKKNPILEINRCYKIAFDGKLPDLKNPKNLIEKIYWMEWNTDTSLWTKCTDKYLMREYVKECGCEQYLPKLYAKWDTVDEINFSNLPETFIMKTNNGCGTCYIVENKNTENINKVKKKFKNWLKTNRQGYSNAQFHYLGIKPCIIAEELLPNTGIQKEISPNSLVDYKVWCFKGQVESILVVYDRTSEKYCLDLYDINWERMSEKFNMNGHFEFRKEIIIPKPECLKEMLEIASKLSRPFPEVRVDFYVVDNKPVIGELTFSTGYGYFTKEYYKYLGDKCDISDLKVIKKKT